MLGLFLRLLFLVYGLHFWDLASQALLFGGRHGLGPVTARLAAVAAETPSALRRFLRVRTLFWLRSDDVAVLAVPWLGVACAVAGFVGYASPWMFLGTCVCDAGDAIVWCVSFRTRAIISEQRSHSFEPPLLGPRARHPFGAWFHGATPGARVWH